MYNNKKLKVGLNDIKIRMKPSKRFSVVHGKHDNPKSTIDSPVHNAVYCALVGCKDSTYQDSTLILATLPREE